MAQSNKKKASEEKPTPRIVVNLTDEQEQVLEQFRAKQDYRPSIKQVVNAAMKEHLGNRGFVWPDQE